MSIFKVLNSEGEEQFLEQMLVQSMVGFQLENLKKAFQPITLPLKSFENPAESQCLGFNLTNIMVKVNKGFIQLQPEPSPQLPRGLANADHEKVHPVPNH